MALLLPRFVLRSLFPMIILHALQTAHGQLSGGNWPNNHRQILIQVNGYSPERNDEYVAATVPAPAGYIVRFDPTADPNRVHHMLLYGCTVAAGRTFWKGGATCIRGRKILYAWARNATNLLLPANVGFSIGHPGDAVQHLVLQVHYSHLLDDLDFSGVRLHLVDYRPAHLAGVLLFASFTSIPPGRTAFFTNASCIYRSSPDLFPFAFRTHTHALGRLVSGFVRDTLGQWTIIGKRSPQWPQTFQMIDERIVIRNGNLMAATCRYDSSDKRYTTYMGYTVPLIREHQACRSTSQDEMCNFYMMFAWDAAQPDPFPDRIGCYGEEYGSAASNGYPESGFELLPPRPDLEMHAHQSFMASDGGD